MASKNNMILCNLPGKIRRTRKQKGWTQTDLGNAMGSDKAFVSRLESGLKMPDLETVRKAADAMDVPLSYWFADETEKPDPFFQEMQERATHMTPEQREHFEKMIREAFKLLGL